MAKRVYTVNKKPRITFTDITETQTPVQGSTEATTTPVSVSTPNITQEDLTVVKAVTEAPAASPVEDIIVMPELDFVPELDEPTATIIGDVSIVVLPDQWKVTAPEDNNNPILLNFYKGKNVITTLPLTQENLETLMPVLDRIYVRPETVKKAPFYKRLGKWAMRHKFSAVILTFIVGAVVYSFGYTLLVSGLGLGIGK